MSIPLIAICTLVLLSLNPATAQRRDSTESDRRLADRLGLDSGFIAVEKRVWPRPTADRVDDDTGRVRNNEHRIAAFHSARTATGVVKLKVTRMTIEGDPVTEYLIVDNGKVTLVIDTTKDRFGSGHVHVCQIERIELGYYVPSKASPQYYEFLPSETIPDGHTVGLRFVPQECGTF